MDITSTYVENIPKKELKDFVFLNCTAEKKENNGAGESSGCFDGTVLECWCSCKSIIQQCQLLIDIVIYEYWLTITQDSCVWRF